MERNKGKKSNVRFLTELALLAAVVILMAFTPLGYLKVGMLSITFIVIPVAVGGVVLGVKGGAALGLVFGLTSFAQCFGMEPFGTTLFGINPWATIFCCIVPRVLVGVVPALVYTGMQRICKYRVMNTAIACVVAPLTNTILFMTSLAVLFPKTIQETYGASGTALFGVILVSIGINALVEAVSCLVIGAAISNVLCRTVNRER